MGQRVHTLKGDILLIDADVLCHRFAYSNTKAIDWDGDGETVEATQPERAKAKCESYVEELRAQFNASDVLLVLSDRHVNFRKEYDPTYKANRKDKPKPELWYVIRDFVEGGELPYESIWYPRLEGDDVLGILVTSPQYRSRSIIVSIDKDMRTLPCRVYFTNKPDDGLLTITKEMGQRYHLSQVVTGDTTDGYPGLKGSGDKAWQALVAQTEDPAELWGLVVQLYESKGKTEGDALLQARLAYILQFGDYNKTTNKVKLWTPDRLRS